MARTTTNLALKVWDLSADLYNHTELAANWDKLDLVVLNRTGGTATGLIRFQHATSTTDLVATRVSTDTNDRLTLRADGRLSWGPGTGAADAVLYRSGTGVLKSDTTLAAANLVINDQGTVAVRAQTSGTNVAVASAQAGDTQDRLQLRGDGSINWGSGSAVVDTNLYRSGASVLKTDSGLTVGATLTAQAAIAHTGSTLGFFGTTPTTRPGTWSLANVTPTRVIDTDTLTIAQLADTLGTLVNDLKGLGLLG